MIRQLAEVPTFAAAEDGAEPVVQATNNRAASPTTPVAIPVAPSGSAGSRATRSASPRESSTRAETAPVLRAKVQPPPLRTSTLSRQRLLDRLAATTRNRLTLVTADAGYGKTTLLADFSRRFDGTCLWYSLDSTDSDWMTILHHLIAAARESRPDFGDTTDSLLRTEPGIAAPKGAAISSFVQELQTFGDERAVLVLDDVHAIDHSEDARQLLARLIKEAPHSFTFILASRRRPELTLARWAGMGELAELTTDDLRFSHDETARLFGDSYGQALEIDVLDEIDARTRGWAACLQLFSTLISGRSPRAIKAAALSLSGAKTPVYDYLAQEVVAHLSPELQSFLTRASLLRTVTPEYLIALYPEEPPEAVERWTAEADALGLLNRASQSGSSRQFHPLLRDFLLGEIGRRLGQTRIAELHARVAKAAESDPLTACHHYIEAGLPKEAMRCLGSSTLDTMGSGRWGTAAQLASRLQDQPPNGAVAVIQARRLLEEGELAASAAILDSIDIAAQEPTVRAVLRHTRLTLGWRSGDSAGLMATLQEILLDTETPATLRDIAQVFLDSSPLSEQPATLLELCSRLRRMAEAQAAAGYGYYAAISYHNAGICALYGGRRSEAKSLGHKALECFEALTIRPPEYYSTHAQLATVAFELGDPELAHEYMAVSQSSGNEHADVHAEAAFQLAVVGEQSRASRFLMTATERELEGHSDLSAKTTATMAQSLLLLPADPDGSLDVLRSLPAEFPLDLGTSAQRYVLRSLSHLMRGDHATAIDSAEQGLSVARRRDNRRCESRLRLILASARESAADLRLAVSEAAQVSDMALPEVADAIGVQLHLLSPPPPELDNSIARWPKRWQPVLRKQLERGNDPRAHIAAALLDKYGSLEDVGRLRAFDKTYRRRGAPTGLGKNLARKVSPRLEIEDLGHVLLSIGGRAIKLSRTRRKPAALLMYLVSRPNFTATREQVIEDLWPDCGAAAGLNSLNQSLYFIRREIDPWYEDDISPEYVAFEAELVSLDPNLVRIASAEFLQRSRQIFVQPFTTVELMAVLDAYRGPFSPEFEYEEWAISWRSRVHAAYLDFARNAILQLADKGDLQSACDVALQVLSIDPAADDIERRLIWLYWHSGATSAAQAQYAHLSAQERSDGLDPTDLEEIVGARMLT